MSTHAPNPEEDIFISYAHIDNQPLAEGLKGWVETFHERLRVRLEQLTGETTHIWRDRKLQGNDIFAETLITRLSKTSIMVVVLSPRYVKSEWCLKELGEFSQCAETSGGLTIGDKSRVFKVVKLHVPVQEHPPQLRDVLGYEFYEYDPERARAREYSPDVTPARDIRYWTKLDDIAYGIIPEEEDKSLVEIQSEVAAECGEELRRIVWMPAGLEPRDERQQKFVNHFRLGLNGHRGIEVLQTSLEDLTQLIGERISDKAKPAAESEGETGEGPPSVYLICDKEDLAEVTPLEDYLFERGFNVFLPALEGDESAIREDHKANLIECDAVMVYYGRGSDVWLRMKQRELQKVAGYGRARPLSAKAIYIAGPPSPAKEHVRDHEALVIKNFDAFSPACLAPFLEKLGKGVRG